MPVAAGIGDWTGKNLVLRPLSTAVTHVPVAGPLAKGLVTKVVVPGGRLAVHSVVTANNLAGHVIIGGTKVATTSLAVAKPVASGAAWVAGNAALGAVDLRFMTAQTTLEGVNQAEKVSRVATAVQAVGGYASQTMDDISSDRLGHAAQDLTELVASEMAAVTEGKIRQSKTAFADTRSALAANLEAINYVRQGQWTGATASMGRSMAAAGGVMTMAGHTEMGFAITQGGHAVEAEAPYAIHLAAVLARANASHVSSQTIQNHFEPKEEAVALSRQAVTNARAGRFQDACLQASAAVALVSGTPGVQSSGAAISWAQSALLASKQDRLDLAGANAGAALSAAGQALNATDPQTAWVLANAGANLRQYASASTARVNLAEAK